MHTHAILELHNSGATQRAIADTLGISLYAVRRALGELSDGSSARTARVLQLIDAGEDVSSIAAHLGVSPLSVTALLRRNGIRMGTEGRPPAPPADYRLRLSLRVPDPVILAHLGGTPLTLARHRDRPDAIREAAEVAWGTPPSTLRGRRVAAVVAGIVAQVTAAPEVGINVWARRLAVPALWLRTGAPLMQPRGAEQG